MYLKYLKKISRQSPIVHVITNNVTNLFVTDVLLAVGAGVIMATDPAEVAEICKASNALCINTGTPASFTQNSYITALNTALENSIPIALDFPGIPGSLLRQNTGRQLLSLISGKPERPPVLIRGNASEIYCLVSGKSHGGSIESIHPPSQVQSMARQLLNTVQALCISGSENIILGERDCMVPGGSPMMSRVSGFGCISTALMAAFLSTASVLDTESPAASAAEAVCYLMRDAAAAVDPSAGPMTFKTGFIDSLYKISEKVSHQEKLK